MFGVVGSLEFSFIFSDMESYWDVVIKCVKWVVRFYREVFKERFVGDYMRYLGRVRVLGDEKRCVLR